MNATSLSARSSLLALLGIGAFLYATSAPRLLASADDEIAQAQNFSTAWVAEIDAGKYDDSYAQACEAMQKKVAPEKWNLVLKNIRAAWGPALSRKQISHIYKPTGYDGLEGECMVITYDTKFQKLDDAMEVIVLKWEDGKWLGAGYNAGPKPHPEDQPAPQDQNQTEIHTDEHVAPTSN